MVFEKAPSQEKKQPIYRSSERKERAKKLIIIGVILAVLLVAVAVFLFIWIQQKPPTPPVFNATTNETSQQNVSSNVTTLCDDDCLMDKAELMINYSICLEIKNATKVQSCLLKLSRVDLEACVQLQNYTNKKTCVEWHALSQKSTEICNNLEVGDRKPCIENIDPCFYKVLADKALCIARLNKNYSYCQKDVKCLFDYARLEKNASACDDIDSKVKKQVCLNIVQNADKCDDLLLAAQIDYCRQLYAIEVKQSDICDKISLDTEPSYECYAFFATEEKNKNYCTKLSLDDEWKCYQKYALAVNDPAACMEISSYAPNARYKCIFDIATTYDNASACEYLNDPRQKIDCYYIAIGFNNEVYPHENCAGIAVDTWKDNCYSTLAKRTSNLTLCDYVLSDGMKKQCISAVKAK